MIKKTIQGIVKSIKENGSISGAVASSEAVDRDGDILVQAGWELENFQKNPVLLWSHNPFALPVGKVTNIGVNNGQLVFDAQFAVEEDDFAAKVFKMIKGGFLNTFSVGFMPKETDEHNRISKMELLEISVVNIPANPQAEVSRDYKSFMEELPYMEAVKSGRVLSEKNRTLIRSSIDSMKASVSALEDLIIATEPTTPEESPKHIKLPKVKRTDPTIHALKSIDKAAEYLLQNIRNTTKEGGEKIYEKKD